MILSQPQYLWLLLLVPVFFAVQVLVLKLRRRRILRFGDEALVNTLMPSYARGKVWVRLSFFAIAFCFIVFALTRPQRGVRLKEQYLKGAEVIIALDVSKSMLAEDYSPNRLERAKLAISRVTEKLHGDRIGLIVFAGVPDTKIPLTSDYVSTKMFINSISTGSIPISGTAIGAAIDLAVSGFSEDNDKSRALIVITDGENHEDDAVAAARRAAEKGVRVFTIGVGTKEGKMIPDPDGGYITDKDGVNVVSHLDEETLAEIASAGNGAYVQANNVEFGLAPVIEEIQNMEDTVTTILTYEEYEELYMYFLAAALFFLVLENLVGDRRSKIHLFRK